MCKLLAPLVLVAGLALSQMAIAQESRDPYQAGVGAYLSGRFDQAEQQLTAAIDASPRDPRPYFYRGLTRLALDKRAEGMDDLEQGATLELAAGYAYSTIDRALAAVQGEPRLTIEKVRRDMRRAAEVTRRTEIAQARRAEREKREKQVLRVRHELPIEALVNQLTPDQALAVANKLSGLPDQQIAAAESPNQALAQSEPAETDPFAAEGDVGNPFALEDEAPEEMTAEAPEVAANPNSPFSNDPFLEGRPQGPPQQQPPGAGGPPAAGAGPSSADFIGGIFRNFGRTIGGATGELNGTPGGGFGGPGAGGDSPFGEVMPEAEEGMTAEEEPADPADGGFGPFGQPTPDQAEPDEMPDEEGEPEPEMDQNQPVNPFGAPTPDNQGSTEGSIGGTPFGVE